MAFETLSQLITEAEAEQAELDQATAALDAAKADLLAVQTELTDKQAAVDAARDAAGTEKGDVVAKIQAVVTRCNEILIGLQG